MGHGEAVKECGGSAEDEFIAAKGAVGLQPETGIEGAEAIDEPGGFGFAETAQAGWAGGVGQGLGRAEVAVGENAIEGLAFEKGRAAGQAAEGVDIGPVAPDEEGVGGFGLLAEIGGDGLAVAKQGEVFPTEIAAGDGEVAGAEAEDGDENEGKEAVAPNGAQGLEAGAGEDGARHEEEEVIAREEAQAEQDAGQGQGEPGGMAPGEAAGEQGGEGGEVKAGPVGGAAGEFG